MNRNLLTILPIILFMFIGSVYPAENLLGRVINKDYPHDLEYWIYTNHGKIIFWRTTMVHVKGEKTYGYANINGKDIRFESVNDLIVPCTYTAPGYELILDERSIEMPPEGDVANDGGDTKGTIKLIKRNHAEVYDVEGEGIN